MSNSTDEDDKSIMHSITGVKRLKSDRVDLYQQKPRNSTVRQQTKNTSPIKELNTVSYNIPSTMQQSWFHHGLQKKQQRKIRTGQIAIDAILDLHGYTQHEAVRQLEDFLLDALQRQCKMLLIIHGKGFNSESTAILRPLVQHWLSEQDTVLAFCPAQPADGGTGASYVYLKLLK